MREEEGRTVVCKTIKKAGETEEEMQREKEHFARITFITFVPSFHAGVIPFIMENRFQTICELVTNNLLILLTYLGVKRNPATSENSNVFDLFVSAKN